MERRRALAGWRERSAVEGELVKVAKGDWDGEGPGIGVVLHVTPAAPREGVVVEGSVRLAIDLVNALNDLGVARHVLVILGPEQRVLFEGLVRGEVEFIDCPRTLRDVAGIWRAVRMLRRLLGMPGVTIVHSYLWMADLVAGLAARGKSVRRFVHFLDTRNFLEGGTVAACVRRAIYGWAVGFESVTVIVCNYGVRDHVCRYLGLEEGRVAVVTNGIRAGDFRLAHVVGEGGELRVGAAGRFQPEKGHLHLLRAFARVLREMPAAKLRIAGAGRMLDDYEVVVREFGMEQSVSFPGRVGDFAGFLSELDVLVMPSVACEGLPLTALNAMAAGVAVIATDRAGVEGVIEDGRDGLVVPHGNDEALAEAIMRLGWDTELRLGMARYGREKVLERFTIEATAGAVNELYAGMTIGRMARPVEIIHEGSAAVSTKCRE